MVAASRWLRGVLAEHARVLRASHTVAIAADPPALASFSQVVEDEEERPFAPGSIKSTQAEVTCVLTRRGPVREVGLVPTSADRADGDRRSRFHTTHRAPLWLISP
jgi:hypothetical protein